MKSTEFTKSSPERARTLAAVDTMPSKSRTREPVAGFSTGSVQAALAAAALDVGLYALLLSCVVGFTNPVLRLALSVLQGLVIARLFILGHDAAHGSLLPRKWMNDLLGRLLFLVSATPFSLWQLGHNTIHHAFTNLRGKDTVWTPRSPAEFAKLPRYRRLLERFYRTPAGVGVYYANELWWKKLFFPNRREVAMQRTSYRLDSAMVLLYFVFLTGLAVLSAKTLILAAVNVFLVVVLPTGVFLWLMGFTIFLHHTHPSVRWFADRSEWSFAGSQLEGTVHILFPRWANRIMHNIFDHTAHHIDVRIPFYRLPAAQAAVEDELGDHIVMEKFSWKTFKETLHRCALYDYDEHVWHAFDEMKGTNQ